MIWRLALDQTLMQWRSLLFWLVLGVSQFLLAWLLFAQLEVFERIAPALALSRSNLDAMTLVVTPSFNSAILLLLIVVPVLAALSISEEKSSGRLSIWLSAAIEVEQFVAIKGIAILVVSSCVMLSFIATLVGVSLAVEVDGGAFLGSSIALIFIVLLASSVSLFASSLSRQPIVVLVVSYAILFFLWLLNSMLDATAGLHWLALIPHVDPLMHGIVDINDVLYFVILSLVAVILSVLSLSVSVGRVQDWQAGLAIAFLLVVVIGASKVPSDRWLMYLSSDSAMQLNSHSLELLDSIQSPVLVTAFVGPDSLEKLQIEKLKRRYQRHTHWLHWRFVDPQKQPELVAQFAVKHKAELVLTYQNRPIHLHQFNEASFSRALRQVSRHDAPWLVFLTGHGEVSINDHGPNGLSAYAYLLRHAGYRVISLDYRQIQSLPGNTAVLVVVDPLSAYSSQLEGEIKQYLKDGGDLLWMTQNAQPNVLANLFAVELLEGVVVDAAAAKVGLSSPTHAIVSHFPDNFIRQSIDGHAQLSTSRAFANKPDSDWIVDAQLSTGQSSWNETAEVVGKIKQNSEQGEKAGPLDVMYALTAFEDPGQRVVVSASSYFVRNSQLGLASNRQLAAGVFAWLTERVQGVTAFNDKALQVSWKPELALSVAVFLTLVLPIAYLVIAVFLYRHRRRHVI